MKIINSCKYQIQINHFKNNKLKILKKYKIQINKNNNKFLKILNKYKIKIYHFNNNKVNLIIKMFKNQETEIKTK